eukprot:758663-Pleurochrysis_carterae.AAC.5
MLCPSSFNSLNQNEYRIARLRSGELERRLYKLTQVNENGSAGQRGPGPCFTHPLIVGAGLDPL